MQKDKFWLIKARTGFLWYIENAVNNEIQKAENLDKQNIPTYLEKYLNVEWNSNRINKLYFRGYQKKKI